MNAGGSDDEDETEPALPADKQPAADDDAELYDDDDERMQLALASYLQDTVDALASATASGLPANGLPVLAELLNVCNARATLGVEQRVFLTQLVEVAAARMLLLPDTLTNELPDVQASPPAQGAHPVIRRAAAPRSPTRRGSWGSAPARARRRSRAGRGARGRRRGLSVSPSLSLSRLHHH